MNKTLIALVVALAAALGLLGKVAWDKRELNQANSVLNEQLMQSKLEIGRANTKFGDAQAYAGELEKALEEEIKARNAEITRYGKLTASYEVLKKLKGNGQVVYVQGPKVKGDKFEAGKMYVALDPRTLVPVQVLKSDYKDFRLDASCIFIPAAGEPGSIPFQFVYRLHLKFTGELVETITPSGAVNHYFNLWEINEANEKIARLKITDFNTIVNNQTVPHFHWWAPHLDVGVLLGMQGTKFRTGGSLGVSFMGYGLTKNDLAWRFPRLSMDLSGSAGIGLTPVQHNLGEYIPLISNLWLGPHATYLLRVDRRWMLGFLLSGVL